MSRDILKTIKGMLCKSNDEIDETLNKLVTKNENTSPIELLKESLEITPLLPYFHEDEDSEVSYRDKIKKKTEQNRKINIINKVRNSINIAILDGRYSTEVHFKDVDNEILNGITEELAKMGITTSISDSELFDYGSGIDKKLFISWE